MDNLTLGKRAPQEKLDTVINQAEADAAAVKAEADASLEELKDACRSRKLAQTGSEDDLCKRLHESQHDMAARLKYPSCHDLDWCAHFAEKNNIEASINETDDAILFEEKMEVTIGN